MVLMASRGRGIRGSSAFWLLLTFGHRESSRPTEGREFARLLTLLLLHRRTDTAVREKIHAVHRPTTHQRVPYGKRKNSPAAIAPRKILAKVNTRAMYDSSLPVRSAVSVNKPSEI